MAGYRNRFIPLMFPELAEDGDEVWVSIRNPLLVPPGELQPAPVPTHADGTPVDPQAATEAMFAVIAKLIVAWRVYDASVVAEQQPLLELPATPESVGRLPTVVLNRIAEEINKINNPQ